MRGSLGPRQRAGAKLPASNEANGQVYTVPAPYGGWNANGNLSNMPQTDAVVMDNVFPGIVDVTTRKGSISWVTGFANPVRALMSYEGPAASKLFAATTNGVYDATAAGAVGAAVFAASTYKWSWTNFANAGGNFLVMVNGQDDMRVYNGATWQAINGASVPAFTGVNTNTLSYVTLHKKRLWFVQANSMDLWYLPVDSFAGAASQFPCGALFRKGGKIIAIADWTLDSGNGQEDYFVILTSRGELAVYQGLDPASSLTWDLIGVYYVGSPMGEKPLTKFGGDLLLMTKNGLYPLSRFLQSAVVDQTSAIEVKIQGAFLDFIEAYQANYGWEAVVYHPANFLIVNVPVAVDQQSYQCVMNITTKAWCRFTGWNATAFAMLGDTLYFAGGTEVCQGWVGVSDKGQPIQAEVVSAYSYLKFGGQKQLSLVRPHIAIGGNATVNYSVDTDFKAYGGSSQVSYINPQGTGVWDSGQWDVNTWALGDIPIIPTWLTVPANLGYLHAFRLQITSSSASVTWTATNFLYRPAGIL